VGKVRLSRNTSARSAGLCKFVLGRNGNVTRALFSATWPLEILNTLTLREQFGEATLTFLSSPLNATEEEWATFEASLEAMHKGFSGTFDRVAEYLAKV
jgi:hypothetical protein